MGWGISNGRAHCSSCMKQTTKGQPVIITNGRGWGNPRYCLKCVKGWIKKAEAKAKVK